MSNQQEPRRIPASYPFIRQNIVTLTPERPPNPVSMKILVGVLTGDLVRETTSYPLTSLNLRIEDFSSFTHLYCAMSIHTWYHLHHDGFISVVRWHPCPYPSLNSHAGFYYGFLGRCDGKPLARDDYFQEGITVNRMNTSEIPPLGISVELVGFHTGYDDVCNFPPGSTSCQESECKQKTGWTVERMFSCLSSVALRSLKDEPM
jgi:hypothetical protein